ncbi:MAG: hypothetical protein H0X19_13655 [Rubrobacter sp.]|jgi:cobalamin biosynthesis protein CobD/CbiB|nr:hypothetical protein [Rubrobacteraceae bacterium]MBA3795161.1 hypothetical protein [Rubrobacter sp.]
MRGSRLLRYALLGGLLWIVIVAFNFFFPMILNSRLLFGGLVALLLAGGLVMVATSARKMVRR